MRKWKYVLFLILLVTVLPLRDQVAASDVFKSSQFLEWPEKTRSFYVRTSVGMAGFIAGQNDKEHAKCLEAWYFGDEDRTTALIYETMRQHPDYHPRAVIVAVLQKQCGSFQYSGG